ncbi:DCP1 [Candida margitis]|uniref:DCP1 n=1 Tax=Candida margitis TaxID=1775924 RepID=UPI002226B893|nr:DCP1 [Candida margitis]KAI5969155.1 DCP1 [Candida margitis]
MAAIASQMSQEQITRDDALKLYTSALNFNVISRYDPAIIQLVCHTSHCVLYKFNEESEEWIKTDYQGALALYERSTSSDSEQELSSDSQLQQAFKYGIIILNRSNPECFSLGILPGSEMEVELNDNLIIIRSLSGEIYGLWLFSEEERESLFKTIQYLV